MLLQAVLEIGADEGICCLGGDESGPITYCEIWRVCILPSKMQTLPLVWNTKALQSESWLCRLGRSVSKELCVIMFG